MIRNKINRIKKAKGNIYIVIRVCVWAGMISQKCEMRLKLDGRCQSCTSRWCLSSFSELSLVPSSCHLSSGHLSLGRTSSPSILALSVLASSVLRSSRLTAEFLRNLPVVHVVDPRCSLSSAVCVVRKIWNGSRQHLEWWYFLLWSFITTSVARLEVMGWCGSWISPVDRLERESGNKFLQYFNMSSSHRPVEGSDLVTGSTPRNGGLPNRISKGLVFTLDL